MRSSARCASRSCSMTGNAGYQGLALIYLVYTMDRDEWTGHVTALKAAMFCLLLPIIASFNHVREGPHRACPAR